ncbi:hypothetical protein A2U01_0039401, partial [Trifolium medium]|nr:hypothetical protein [Trifolium medium]
ARSLYISIGIDKSYRVVGDSDEWEAVLPGEDYAVSDRPLYCVVPMHEVVIESIQVSLPFTKFEVFVLNFLMVAPSQIHPFGWALIKAYQFWFAHMRWRLALRLFFTLFHVTRHKEGGRFGLISFNQSDRLFEDFTDIPEDFLRRFYWGKLTDNAAASEKAFHKYVDSLEMVSVPDPRDPS